MNNNEIMVSVLCAAFNHEQYLVATLDSFLAQKTNFPIEIIVNDDCSTDSTAEIIRAYAEKYPNIIRPVFQEKNQFSLGVEIYEEIFFPRARGRYFAICEGDDFWSDPEKLQLQVDFLEKNPEYSACVHNTMLHYCAGDNEDVTLLPAGNGDRDVAFAATIQGMSGAWHTSSLLGRREHFLNAPDFLYAAVKYGFSDQPRGIWLTMQGKVRWIDRTMSVYRLNSNPHAWSSGVDGQYEKHVRFVKGETEMLKMVLPHVAGEEKKIVEQSLLEHEFELLYIQGRDKELIRPPYREIYRKKGLAFRTKQWVKRNLPFIQQRHRAKKGYGN